MKRHLLSLSIIFLFCNITGVSAQTIRYVKQDAVGNGSSWNMASGDLQAMINLSISGDQVWVAGGIYYPIRRADVLDVITPNDRHNAFVLKNNVKIYGGFIGIDETSISQRDSTRININSILSGDLGLVRNNTDNAYHVVLNVTDTGISELNGFIIVDGNANGDFFQIEVSEIEIPDYSGGGIQNAFGNLNLFNSTISGNRSNAYGGGIENTVGSTNITNVIISGNETGGRGGGIFNAYGKTVFTNVIISGNVALNGGGMVNDESSPFLTNVTISGNIASEAGGAITNSLKASPQIRNSIIYGNSSGISSFDGSFPVVTYSLVQSMNSELNGNISGDKDPLFKDQPPAGLSIAGDFHLKAKSPVINKGNDNYYNNNLTPNLSLIKTDLEGNERFINTVDFGAYEYPTRVVPVTIVNFTTRAEGSNAKLNWSTATESNNKEFTISRSTDGQNFKEIGIVVGAGNTNTKKDYVFYDENPMSGINFYRLAQVDYDGNKTELGVRTVNLISTGNNLIKVFPNPVKNVLRISFSAGQYHSAEITDVGGMILQRLQINNVETEKKIDMSNMAAGIYFIKLAGKDKVESKRIVKE